MQAPLAALMRLSAMEPDASTRKMICKAARHASTKWPARHDGIARCS